ncbi:MAG: molecular chaperone DnaJ [Paludibacteraceae bacterium]|nr:molecular chaperone DnaJ [Paludibacteraceae bacterium]
MARKETNFKMEGVELCGNCHGTGYDAELDCICPICEGSGRVYKTRKGIVTVEPYKGKRE